MRTVYKYELDLLATTKVVTKEGATPLHFARDGFGNLCAWLEVETDSEDTVMELTVVGTGHEIPVGLVFVASLVDGSGMVWHLYRNPE